MDRETEAAEGRGMASKGMRCRLGIHSWETLRNDDGEAYLECRRCGAEGDKIHLGDYGDTGGGSMG
jgi:hypothetical protein